MYKQPTFKLFATFLLVLIAAFFYYSNNDKQPLEDKISEQRTQHAEFLKNSPFKESLGWDKKTRKQKGLPPNRYFEQMWELTINPRTGKLDEDELTNLREFLKEERKKSKGSGMAQRNPGDAANAWEERGPNNVGGRTRVIMFDPNDSSNNIVYAGGVSGGLWKNTNITSSSSTWARVENVPGNLSVTSISVDPRNSNIWYVGTGEQYTAGDVVGNGVYVTTDGGNSWNALNIPPADNGDINYSAANLFLSGIYYVNDVLAWDNGASTELFVAVGAHVYGDSSNPTNWLGLQSSGLYHSTNGGSTWNRIESANMQHTFGGETYYYIPNDLEVSANNTLWMGTIGSSLGEGGGHVYSSTNGSTWTEAAASPLADSNRVELEPSATNANKIYALTQGVTSPVHIYQTTNAFASITSTSLPNDADTGIDANDFCRGQAFYDLVIEADPANDNIVYVGGIDLFKSTNGGSSWSQLSHWYGGFGQPNDVHADQHSIAFGNNSSSRMLYGNDGGIYYSGNAGSTISVRNNGYNVTQFVKAGIGPDGNGDTDGVFSAGAQDNGTQAFRDGNASPGINSSEELSDGDGFYTFVDKDGDYMIATYVFNVIYRFNLPWNGQGRIDGAATTLSSSQTTGDFVNQMGYDDDANRLLSNNSSGTSYSILSINVAANSNGTLTNTALTAKPTAFTASPFANNTWYVGMANGGLLRLTNVGNSSASWTTISTPFVGSVSSVRFGETANDLIVTMHNYGVTSVWYSSDAGLNWTSKEGNLPNIPVRDFLLNPLNSNEAIIGTQLGVWETSDFNASNPSWSQAYNGMSDVSVTSLDYWDVSGDDTNNKVIASTYGRGVFTGSFTATTIPDTEAPTNPTNLAASNITESTIDLNWTVSTDNVGVSGYDVYQDGSLITNVSGTSYQATSLTANTAYSFYIIARDASNNTSGQSNSENATTLAPDTEAPTSPSNLVASNVTDSSVTLNWTAATDNVAVTEYDVYQGSTVISTVAGTTVQVLGLSPNTTYNYSVIAKDAAGNESSVSNQVAVTTDAVPITYCSSASTNVNDEYISRVQLGSIDNTSGAQFYSDFTSQSTTLTKESQYTITITPTWTGTVYNESYAVWIDYNKNGDFTDSGEQVYSQGNTQATSVSGDFTIPAGAVENSTRMRVSMKYNASPTSCETFQYGEVEDYTVIIEGSGPDTVAPVITLNGASTIDLDVGNTYNELGATALDNIDGDITSSIVVGGSVDTNTGGTYLITYDVSDAAGNAATQAVRTVNVIPDTTAPVITLVGASSIDLNLGGTYTEQGATATDNIDGNITAGIVIGGTVDTNTSGTYLVTYDVSDAAGNAATQVVRTVNVIPDTTAPVITLVGISSIDLNLGDTYSEQGATASDNIDGDITANIVTGGDVVNTNLANTYLVTYNVSDAAGNVATQVIRTVNVLPDTTAPTITINGASVINLNVGDTYNEQGATASDNIDGDITSSIVLGGDTVNTGVVGTYNVTYNVSDAAGNSASQVSRTINVSTPTTGCSGGIASFPYAEGFENTLGGWAQSSSDDLDWLIDANGTPSSNTGPSSAEEGSFYLFVEASGNGTGYPNKRALLTSPCFDLSALTEATFSFNYHMYGATDMGTIDLEISDDEGNTWTSIWNESGNKGNSWQAAVIDLTAYTGGSIQLRFNRFVGSTWQADIAIDNIGLTEGEIVVNSCSGGITSYPYSEGYENTLGLWTQSSADDLDWLIDANGTPSNNTGPSSANQGSYYIFVEASGNNTGYPNKQAIINSPCYDLSAASQATFSFDYHMYGSNNMGTIALEASNDNGANWTPIWNESGNKGNTWLSANINLSAYIGNSLQLRFNRVTGTTWQADIALDNISLTSVAPVANIAPNANVNVSDDPRENINNKLSLYPNPVGSMLNIKTSKGGNMSYRIISALGQIVDRGQTYKEIPVDNLEAGMYFIEVDNDGNKLMERFMKE